MGQWTKIKDKTPEEDEWVLGANLKEVEKGLWLGKKKGFVISDLKYPCFHITHWMPLPEPPKN